MGLSYHYEFTAPASTDAEDLERFLRSLEFKAKTLGFSPTAVLNVPFDTEEQRAFARRLGGGYYVEDEKLRGDVQLGAGQVFHHNSVSGSVRLVPTCAAVLVVTDESGCESAFGFMRFPNQLVDTSGKTVVKLEANEGWKFKDYIDSPDTRYRALVREFQRAGYLASSSDEFARSAGESSTP